MLLLMLETRNVQFNVLRRNRFGERFGSATAGRELRVAMPSSLFLLRI
jgi:hypothetical protein